MPDGRRFPTIDRFEVLEVIGRGGFATVYRARQYDLGRLVALKVIHPGHRADPDMMRRFERECQAIGSLSGHPAVMTLFEAGATADGDPYLALELLPDGSLQQRLETGPPPSHLEVVQVGIAVADALAAAHGVGIVHRDVKPANILSDRFGSYKLGDFGISGLGPGTSTSLETTATTVAYSAPEVLLGKRATVSSDLYGLGATLYALLTGAPAFSAGDDESIVPMIYRVTTMPLDPLPDGCGPKALRDLVEQLMAKEPEARPASAAEVAIRLRQIATEEAAIATWRSVGTGADQPVGAGPTERRASVPETEARRWRGWIWALAAVAVLGVLVAGVLVVLRDDAGQPTLVSIAVGDAPRWLALGEGALWVSNHDDGTVSRVDPTSNEVVATIKVGESSGPLVVADGAVWVSSYETGTVTRLDPVSNTVAATIHAGVTPDWMVAGHGSVWVANYNSGTVTRIDPGRNAVSATIEVGQGPRWLAVADDAVWVSTYDSVMRIDPASSEVVATVELERPGSLVVTSQAVWAAIPEGVVRVDPRSNAVAGSVELDEPPGWLAVVEGEVWASIGDRVVRLAEAGDAVAAEVQLEGNADWRGAGAGELWVTSSGSGTVTQVRASAAEVTASYAVDGRPGFVVVDDDAAWVASEQAGTVTRIDRQP